MLRVRSLSPFGPIFGMELRTAARRKRMYLLRMLYLGGLLLFLLLTYAITRDVGFRGAASRIQQQEMLGSAFFMCFSIFSVLAMALIGPVLTSTAISGERLRKTLHVLLITPINAWQIVAGKLFSRMLGALMLVGLSLPVLALVRLLGGVELHQMFGVIALCAVMALAGASVGLLYSTLLTRTYAVILLSYFTLFLVYLIVPMVMGGMVAALGAGWQTYQVVTLAINPVLCTVFVASGQLQPGAWTWLPCVLVHLAFSGMVLLLVSVLLRRIARRAGEESAPPTVALPLPVAGAEPIPPAKVKPPKPVGNNPVLWRELRRPMMSRRWQRWTMASVCILTLALTYLAFHGMSALDDRDLQIGYSVVMYGLLTLVTCVLSATAIAQEKETDTWTVLLASPLGGSAIVWGKVLGILRRLTGPLALIAAHFGLFALFGVIDWTTMAMVVWVMFTFNAIWIATGVVLALWLRATTTAVIINLLLPVLLYAGAPLVLLLVDTMFGASGEVIGQATWFEPFYFLVVIVEDFFRTRDIYFPALRVQYTFDEFVNLTLVIGLVHLLLAGSVLLRTAWRFNRIVGRAEQLGGRGDALCMQGG